MGKLAGGGVVFLVGEQKKGGQLVCISISVAFDILFLLDSLAFLFS